MHRHRNVSVFALFTALIVYGSVGAADRTEPTRVLATNPSQVQLDRVERIINISSSTVFPGSLELSFM